MSNLRFGLIGPGRVGISLAYLLSQQGLTLTTVVGHSFASLEQAQRYLRGGVSAALPEFTTDLKKLPDQLDLILLAVRDDQIATVVKDLWQQNVLRPNQGLIHFSGTLPADVGQLPGMTEIRYLAMHPLQAVASIEAGITRLTQCVWSLEGEIEAVQMGEKLLTALGVRWLKIAREQKTLYHAAACVASNYLVTIIQMASEMLKTVGFPPELAEQALLPLIAGTIENLREKKPEEALTGPIARGDIGTVEKHIQAIAKANPDWLLSYAALGKATLQFARLEDKTGFDALFTQKMIEFTQLSRTEEEDL